MSVAPAARSSGTSVRTASRGTAARTANPSWRCSLLTVGAFMAGSRATTASSDSGGAFISSSTRSRLASTPRSSTSRFSIASRLPASSSAAGWARNRVVLSITVSTVRSRLARSVAPVAVLSTTRSASSGGNTSVAP